MTGNHEETQVKLSKKETMKTIRAIPFFTNAPPLRKVFRVSSFEVCAHYLN